MNKWAFCFLFILSAIAIKVYAKIHTDDILGVWLSMEKTSKIKIYKCGIDGKKYCGKIVWLKRDKEDDNTPRLDKNNPDPKKRKTHLYDLVILKLFEFDEEKNEWNNGNIYDPYTGMTYKCYIKKEGSILKIRGFVGISLIGRTAEWTKAD